MFCLLKNCCLSLALGFSLLIASSEESQSRDRPIVVIPGIMGSKLCDENGKIVWGDKYSYAESRLKQIALPWHFAPEKLRIKSCGLIDQISIIPYFWEKAVYRPLLEVLKSFGISEQRILLFDYDWRLSNLFNAARLRALIESRYPDKTIKIDIVAHSMGGIVARSYIQQFEGDARVQNLILMGTPNRGSATIFKRLKEGLEQWPDIASGGLTQIQRTILSFPSTYQLLPSYADCCAFSKVGTGTGASYFSIFEPSAWKKFSWLPSEYKSNDGQKFIARQLQEAHSVHQLMQAPIFKSTSTSSKVFFLANGFIDTWSRVFFDPDNGRFTGFLERPGDRTVLLFSATNSVPSDVRVSHNEHESVFVGDAPTLLLKAILSDTEWTKGPTTSFERLLKDAQGRDYTLLSLGYDVIPRVARPNSDAVYTVKLKGDSKLKDADLTHVRVNLVGSGTAIALPLLQDEARAEGNTIERAIRFSVPVPNAEEVYLIHLVIPGLELLEERLLVIKIN